MFHGPESEQYYLTQNYKDSLQHGEISHCLLSDFQFLPTIRQTCIITDSAGSPETPAMQRKPPRQASGASEDASKLAKPPTSQTISIASHLSVDDKLPGFPFKSFLLLAGLDCRVFTIYYLIDLRHVGM